MMRDLFDRLGQTLTKAQDRLVADLENQSAWGFRHGVQGRHCGWGPDQTFRCRVVSVRLVGQAWSQLEVRKLAEDHHLAYDNSSVHL